MPQGVEHPWRVCSTRFGSRVKGTVMPQGVEHRSKLFDNEEQDYVKGTVMPQGVEHATLNYSFVPIQYW